jgi:sugar O-acyltransferase (sialic acid O-acetyltransferase NeuD family)
MTRELIIFGNSQMAQLAKYYFENDSPYKVVAFVVDSSYITSPEFEGLPVYPFEHIEQIFPPSSYHMFIAIGYSHMNRIRERKFYEAKSKGYYLVSYISSQATYLSQYKYGENCFIHQGSIIEPFSIIEDNVIIWSGTCIAHHSIIKSHNFLAPRVVVSGNCIVESNCFLGVNAVLSNGIKIASGTLLGAGVVITRDTEPDSVYVSPRALKLPKRSDEIRSR